MAVHRGRGEKKVGLALSYAAWTERLSDHFFREERAGQPVTFFIDDELLGELEGSGDPAKGVASLTDAVRPRLAPDSWGRRFQRIFQESTAWKVKGGEGCPPALPLLAVAVLAATHMARGEGISMRNYWKRFRDLLGLQDTQDLKGNGDVFPALWEQLKWWLNDHHHEQLGRCTVEKDEWWTIIGYALSQALFRESDRQRLTALFARIGLEPGEHVDRQELLQRFKAWVPVSNLSEGAKHMAGDSRYDERLGTILAEEAERWDGVERDEAGRRLGALVLTYEPTPRPTYKIGAECPHGFPESGTFANADQEIHLTGAVDGWYAEQLPLDPRWLRSGVRLDAGKLVLSYRAAPVVPLARNRVLGCWASVSHVEPGEKYCVISDLAHDDSVEGFLRTYAVTGWKRAPHGFAPQDWVLFTDVTIEESVPAAISGPLAVLAPTIRERPTLRGGLSVDPVVGLYLQGGEPDLWLPSLMAENEKLVVDGRPVTATAGQRVALSGLALPAGQHEILLDSSPLHFSTTKHFRTSQAPGTGDVRHVLANSDGAIVPAGTGPRDVAASPEPCAITVAGACIDGPADLLPASAQTIVLPLRARRCFLVGAQPGQVAAPEEPPRPAWLDTVGDGLFPIGYEASASFDVVWVIVDWHEGRAEVRLRRPVAPGVAGSESHDVGMWCEALGTNAEVAADAQKLWREYREAAAQLAPGHAATARTDGHQPRPVRLSQTARPRRSLAGFGLSLGLVETSDLLAVYATPEYPFEIVQLRRTGKWQVATPDEGHGRKSLGTFTNESDALADVRARLDGQPTASPSAKYELLLRWASERGRGTWSQFRDAHDWLFNAGQQDAKQTKATTTIHNLSIAGHIEIDWDSGEWAIAPPAITILPTAGAHAILTGARTGHLVERFLDAAEEADLYTIVAEQDWGPNAMLVAANSEEGVEALAAKLGLAYEMCVSERLAQILPQLDAYLAISKSTPAARGYGIEKFDARMLLFRSASDDSAPGLYRYDLWGRPEYRFISDDGEYYKVDHALGVYAELRRCGKREIRLLPDGSNGTLQVPFRAQLPALHARTATLCSGLMPRLTNWKWHYPNVPKTTAAAIAESLGQQLVISQN